MGHLPFCDILAETSLKRGIVNGKTVLVVNDEPHTVEGARARSRQMPQTALSGLLVELGGVDRRSDIMYAVRDARVEELQGLWRRRA